MSDNPVAPSPTRSAPSSKPDSGIWNLVFNVVIPIFLLNKFSEKWGALPTLFAALAFPLAFGVFDLIKKRKMNYLSVFGFLNVLVTGSLAVSGLGGIWFSIKEAFFPMLIGLFVLFSAWGKKPFIATLVMNPQFLNIDNIQAELQKRNNFSSFSQHLKISTIFLSISFFLSAVLNFVLGQRIFLELDPTLESEAKSVLLNQQIAEMTKWSFLVIMVPSMISLMLIMWHLFKGIGKLTGLKTDEYLKN